ncbi:MULTISPECIES: DUF4397 domain-containing protein [unclassified Streptomyces]|uniref:DUF4397 domain-containing protein n=1 Tax=unclassified Streptomyces TaxID=2593676 RepID=UPI001904FB35|nr:DUF4397 domain-containing protein [Streptomyces sp. HSG2]
MTRRTSVAVAAAAGAGALALGVAAPAAAAPAEQDGQATVSVFHGVPGLTADVYANGEELVSDLEPGSVTDPQTLDAGTYDIKVVAAGDGPDGTAAVEKEVKVSEGSNATVAAHLTEDGDPELTAYANDVSQVDDGKSRLTVRHVAAAPAVDVRAGGDSLFTDLQNPDEDTTVVDAGTVSAEVVLAGTDTVAIGPADLDLEAGTTNIVYAWGSADEDNLALATQTLDDTGSSSHGSVPTDTRLASVAPNSAEQWLAWTAAVGAVSLTGVLLSRRFANGRD